jgi:hypothetical protein
MKTKDCEICGNRIPAQAFTCQFCNASQSVENFPKTLLTRLVQLNHQRAPEEAAAQTTQAQQVKA